MPPITTIGPPQAGLPPQAITGGKVNPYSPFIDPSTLDKPITDKPLEGVFGGKPLLNSYKDLPGADTWSKYVGQAAVIGVGAIFLLSGLYMFKPATVAVIRNAASV